MNTKIHALKVKLFSLKQNNKTHQANALEQLIKNLEKKLLTIK